VRIQKNNNYKANRPLKRRRKNMDVSLKGEKGNVKKRMERMSISTNQ